MMLTNTSFKSAASTGLLPVVMAYIGTDDPNRGDSKGTIGLSRLVAEILNGRSVYLDQAILDDSFGNCREIKDQLNAYMKYKGYPDIVIGSYADIFHDLERKPALLVTDYNENVSQRAKGPNKYVVCHELTPELLKREAEKFRQNYSDISGPLVAVLLGGILPETSEFPQKLARIISTYSACTLFICPSRRTGNFNHFLKEDIEKNIGHSSLWERLGLQKSKARRVMAVDYHSAIRNYNPYLGLLGLADHVVVAGSSSSIISEALYTGKTVYSYRTSHVEIDEQDTHIKDIMSLEIGPFPTQALPRIDVSRDVAQSIADEYLKVVTGTPVLKDNPASKIATPAIMR